MIDLNVLPHSEIMNLAFFNLAEAFFEDDRQQKNAAIKQCHYCRPGPQSLRCKAGGGASAGWAKKDRNREIFNWFNQI